MDITLFKAGGSCLEDSLSDVVCQILEARCEKMIVVHGFSVALRHILSSCGIRRRSFVSASGTPSNFTGEAELYASMLAAWNEGHRLLQEFRQQGHRKTAVVMGHRGLLFGERKKKIRFYAQDKLKIFRDDLSGKFTGLNRLELSRLLEHFDILCLNPILMDIEEGPVVCDADTVAAGIALELGITSYTILSQLEGFMADAKVLPHISRQEIGRMAKWADGGMVKKLKSIQKALDAGVQSVHLRSGRLLNQKEKMEGTIFHADQGCAR